MLILVPVSVSYAGNQRVEKLVELAERAKEKTQILINMTCLNATAMDAIELAGFKDQLNDNVSVFDEAAYNITVYQDVANLTLALGVFREVYKSINRILAATPEVQRGQLVDAQGLLQAMTRALDRIERLGEIGELPDEAVEALNYLNVTQAILWLQEGRVEDVTENLTTANKLIADAHKALKDIAKEMNTNRIRAHIKVMTNFRERLYRQLDKIEDKTQVEAALGEAGDHIADAEDFLGNGEYSNALDSLEDAKDDLNLAEQRLKEQRRAEKTTGKGKGKP